MIRLFMSCAVAVALVWGCNTDTEAAIATPKLAALKAAPPDFVAETGWKCDKRHCFWDPAYTGPVPDFAANWGPPEAPTCYYVQRRISKRWAKVCPEVPWQAR